MANGWTRVRMKATGQVIDMLPSVAAQKIAAGMAELAETPEPEVRMFAALQNAARQVGSAIGIVKA